MGGHFYRGEKRHYADYEERHSGSGDFHGWLQRADWRRLSFFCAFFGVQRSLALSPVFIAACVAAGISVGVVNIVLTRSIVLKHIRRITGAAGEITRGDLNVDIAIKSADEIGDLSADFESMTERLNDVLSGVCAAFRKFTSGAEQLSNTGASLAQGASRQASAIEPVTVSLEQISAQTARNAKDADEANRLAIVARGNAEDSNRHMKEMLRAMDETSQSSEDISRVIRVIDDIAF